MKILQIVGYKNTGKTTTISELVEWLNHVDKRVVVIKHHHNDDAVIDDTVDTGKFLMSGAQYSILNTPSMSEVLIRHDGDESTQLTEQIKYFNALGVDVLLIEGYKEEEYPKITLNYSFKDEKETNINNIGLSNVVGTFDLRYDKETLLEWFKEWIN